jgi:hypothetical protein
MAKTPQTQYRLTQSQLRALTMKERPALDANGNTVLVANPGHKGVCTRVLHSLK